MPTTTGQLYFGSISLAGAIAPPAPTLTVSKAYNETTDKWDVDLDYTWVENGATVTGAEYSTDGGSTWSAAPAPGSYTGTKALSYSVADAGNFAVRLTGTVANGKKGSDAHPIPALPAVGVPSITSIDPRNTGATVHYAWTDTEATTITGLQYRLNGGAWTAASYSTSGNTGFFDVSGLTDGVTTTIEIRHNGTHRDSAASAPDDIVTYVLPAGSPVVLTTSGNWTVPAGLYEATVTTIGGGGGGGRGGTANTSLFFGSGGGGGGSGYVDVKKVSLTPSDVHVVTIGAGGGGGTSNGAAPTGGTSSLGNLTSRTGGLGGTRGNACGGNDSVPHNGGAGGGGSANGAQGTASNHNNTANGGAGGTNNTYLVAGGGAGGRGETLNSGARYGSAGSSGKIIISW